MENSTSNTMTTGQTILAILLYLGVILCILLSIKAINNIGSAGFRKCLVYEYNRGGSKHLSKYRTINNCCQGSGGQLGTNAATPSKLACVIGNDVFPTEPIINHIKGADRDETTKWK